MAEVKRAKKQAKTTNKVGQTTKIVGQSSIAVIFSSPTLVELLKVFALNPDAEFYQRELARMTGKQIYSLQRELARLERAGLIKKTKKGNRLYYSAEKGSPAFEDLKSVFLKTVALADVLREAISPLTGDIRIAFIYGSLAKREERAASDIDLMIVGDISPRKLISRLSHISAELNRELNPMIYPTEEFCTRIREKNNFLETVLKEPKTWLIGNEADLKNLLS